MKNIKQKLDLSKIIKIKSEVDRCYGLIGKCRGSDYDCNKYGCKYQQVVNK